MQALALATERSERQGLFFILHVPISSLVATYEQSKNIATAHLEQLLATRDTGSNSCSFHLHVLMVLIYVSIVL